MFQRTFFQRTLGLASLVLISSGLAATPAFAYVGPGAGLTAIGTMIAVILALVLAVVGFVWYPLKRLMRKKRTASTQENVQAEEASDDSRGSQ